MAYLIDTLDAYVKELKESLVENPVLHELMQGTISEGAYAYIVLPQAFHYTRDTPYWLHLSSLREGNPVFASYLAECAAEEMGHCDWARNDALAAGANADIMDRVLPSPGTQSYVAYNAAASEIGSPKAILGTKYLLEALSVDNAGLAVENLLKRRLIPGIENCIQFLKLHSMADLDHFRDLRVLLARVDSPADQQAILLSARMTVTIYPGIFA